MNPPKLKGLGRGLDALLAANTSSEGSRRKPCRSLPFSRAGTSPGRAWIPLARRTGGLDQGPGSDSAHLGAAGGQGALRNHRR